MNKKPLHRGDTQDTGFNKGFAKELFTKFSGKNREFSRKMSGKNPEMFRIPIKSYARIEVLVTCLLVYFFGFLVITRDHGSFEVRH